MVQLLVSGSFDWLGSSLVSLFQGTYGSTALVLGLLLLFFVFFPKFGKPGSPRNLNVQVGSASSVVLTWTKSESDGGEPIQSYIVEKRDNINTQWNPVLSDVNPEDTTCIVPDLTEGYVYTFRVAAKNSVGVSKFTESQPIEPKPLHESPSAPGKPTISDQSANSIKLHWSTPQSDGGADISNYVLQRMDHFNNRWEMVSTDIDPEKTLYSVDDLTEGHTYQFRVAAKNSAGLGLFSEPSDAVLITHQSSIPESPRNLNVQVGSASSVVLTWTKSESDGGEPIQSYIVEKRDNINTQWKLLTSDVNPEDTTCIVPDLTEGYVYTFRVAARNSVGVSKFTESKPIKPKPLHESPSAPEKPTVRGQSVNNIKLHWSTPQSNGGAEISNYVLQRMDHFNNRWEMVSTDIDPEKTLYSVDDLTEGHTYQFRVAAKNSAGLGLFSEPSDAVLVTQQSTKEMVPKSLPGFIAPRGISFDHENNIIIADNNKKTLNIAEKRDGKYIVSKVIPLKRSQQHKSDIMLWETTLSKNGEILFTDSANNQIVIQDVNQPSPLNFVGHGERQFKPRGIAMQNEKIVVTNIEKCCVSLHERSGKLLSSFGRYGTNESEFSEPMSVVVNSKGHIIVSDKENHRVSSFELSDSGEAELKYSHGSKGDGPHDLLHPSGLAIDSTDNVYICDSSNGRVVVLSPTGELNRIMNLCEPDRPLFIAVSTDKSLLAVSYSEAKEVKVYSLL